MKTLWLSYSWKDNIDEDVDFIAQEIEKSGVRVHQDRFVLVAGQRLWPQIEAAISDPNQSDGWAIFLTQNSLASEAVREEMAYALDRALSRRGTAFLLIGISAGDVKVEDVPRMIGSRLFTDLRDKDWVERVRSAIYGEAPHIIRSPVSPIQMTWHQYGGKPVFEVRPRAGRWYPAFFVVQAAEFKKIKRFGPGPSGMPTGSTMVSYSDWEDRGVHIWRISQNITPIESLYIYFEEKPAWVEFGAEGQLYRWPAA